MSTARDDRQDARRLPREGETDVTEGVLPMVPEPATLYARRIEGETTHFWDYWQVLRRRRSEVVCGFLVTLAAAMLWSFTTRPTYTGTAMVRIEKDEPRVLKFEEVVKEADNQQDYYQTQWRLLGSRTLANRVIADLELESHPEFQRGAAGEGWLANGREWVRQHVFAWVVIPPLAPQETRDLAAASPVSDAFLRRLSIEPVRASRLVKVSFESQYPDLAARVANTVADTFIAEQLRARVDATRAATQFLGTQVDEVREKLGQAEERLNAFLKANDILFIAGGEKTGQPQDLVTQQLGILSEGLLKARGERIARESILAQTQVQDAGSVPAVLQSSLIAQLKQEGATLEGEYRRLSQTFKPEYPKLRQLKEKIDENRRQIRAEVERALASVQAEYRAAAQSERELERAMARQRGLARGVANNMAEYNLLRRQVDTGRDLYTSLLGRLQETQVSAALLMSNISVVDPAVVPNTPTYPRKTLVMLIGIVFGVAGGIGLAFFSEYLDTTIKDVDEIEERLRVPALGQVPSHAALSRRGRWIGHGHAGGAAPFALLARNDLPSLFGEAFRNLRTALLYAEPDRPPKSLMVTSLQQQDGKTSVASNLAITLAQLGGRPILVVDADMRRPTLHHVLGVDQAPGLSAFLSGRAALDDVIVESGIPNLFVIPAGKIPANPAELLASPRLRDALEALGDRFAHVVFDTAPIFGISDAMVLAARVEGTVLVLRRGRSTREAARMALRSLGAVRGRVLGVVLNDVDVRSTPYAYASYERDGRQRVAGRRSS